MPHRWIPAILTLALSTSGCTYLQARGADFLDVFTLEASLGPGLHVIAHATDFVGTGIGSSKQHGVALHGRYAGMTTRVAFGAGFVHRSSIQEPERLHTVIGPHRAPSEDEWLSPGYQAGFMYIPVLWFQSWGTMVESEGLGTFPRGIRTFDISVGASALVGVHLGFSPGELLDFLLGWTTLDIAGDDVTRDVEPVDDDAETGRD